jgi:hypothetical protein
MANTRKFALQTAAILGIAASIGVMNHLAGTPLAQSALVAAVFVSLTYSAAKERGITISSGSLSARFLLVFALVVAAIVGAVIAELLGLK